MWRSCALADSSRRAKSRCSARSSASAMSVGSSYASAAIDVQASGDLLLGGLVEGALPVGCAGLEGHERKSRTGVRLDMGGLRSDRVAAEAHRAWRNASVDTERRVGPLSTISSTSSSTYM